MLFYSYQYNIEIVSVPHISENESSNETVELCVKLLLALRVETPISDKDTAHWIPQRNNMSSNGRRRPNPIICKFTRRMSREKVLAAKSNSSTLTVGDLGLPTTATLDHNCCNFQPLNTWVTRFAVCRKRLPEVTQF